jgi:hypothetical protein
MSGLELSEPEMPEFYRRQVLGAYLTATLFLAVAVWQATYGNFAAAIPFGLLAIAWATSPFLSKVIFRTGWYTGYLAHAEDRKRVAEWRG